MQDVVSVRHSGFAHYKAINTAEMGKAPHSSLSDWKEQGMEEMEKTVQNLGICLWKQVNLIQALNVTYSHQICHFKFLKTAGQI